MIAEMISKIKRHFNILVIVLFALSNLCFTGIANASLNTVYVGLSSQVTNASSLTYTFHMKPSVTQAIKQVNIKFCTNAGTVSAACTALTTLSFALPASGSVTFGGFGSNTLTSATGTTNVESAVITTPASETTTTDHTVAIAAITNPNAYGVYYARIQTYSDAGTTVIDESDIAFAMIPAVAIQRLIGEFDLYDQCGWKWCYSDQRIRTIN